MKKEELYKSAIDTWGQALQLVMVLEETAELQKEVCKIIRGDWSSSRMDSLASEIADVELCVGQLKYITGTQLKVDIETELKIRRLEKKLLLAKPIEERRKILEKQVAEINVGINIDNYCDLED